MLNARKKQRHWLRRDPFNAILKDSNKKSEIALFCTTGMYSNKRRVSSNVYAPALTLFLYDPVPLPKRWAIGERAYL